MTMTKTRAERLYEADLRHLDIDVPRDFVSAYRVDDDTINIVVTDPEGGSCLDPPNEDHSGANAWEWTGFDNGRQRDAWIEEHPEHHPDTCPATTVWIERYEHSLVRYAPLNEASAVDRQWDVAMGVAVMIFKPEEWGKDPDFREIARTICDEYTSWCNGDAYGIITFRRRLPVDAPNCPVLIPEQFAREVWEEEDSCWGFLGDEYAERTARENDL